MLPGHVPGLPGAAPEAARPAASLPPAGRSVGRLGGHGRLLAARKLGLDEELAAHAAAIEQRVGEVEGTAAAFRADIVAYTERLSSEEDPARLATMAESMPEPPVLDTLADLDDLELDLSVATLAPYW
mgnify:CR=1 FL=1